MAADDIREQAAAWAVRTGDPGFEDWDGFTHWLEQDPAHARAYDAIGAAADEAAQLLRRARPANDETIEAAIPPRVARRAWLGGALAASLTLVLGFVLWPDQTRELYRIETPMGKMQTVALGEGSTLDLAGGTVIELDGADPRYARLGRGQALFTIRHDASDPFQLDVGGDRLVDAGTIFEVRYDGANTVVSVSEGAVQFAPDGADVRLDPGQSLTKDRVLDRITLGTIPVAQVGEWSKGRLTFTDSTLGEVADELTRLTGISFVSARGASATLVSGSILIDPVRENPASLAPLLGVKVSRSGEDWVIGAN